MALLAGRMAETQWDDVMFHIARWLLRHLGDPRLLLWVAGRGGQLHSQWLRQIEDELERLSSLEREGKFAELEELRVQGPNSVPRPLLRTLWRLVLGGHVRSTWAERDLFRWRARLKREGLTASLRLELRELLAPKVTLASAIRWGVEADAQDERTLLRREIEWEVVLAAGDALELLRADRDERWGAALPLLVEEFQGLLSDALELLQELGDADELHDRSFWSLPSIAPHWQNRSTTDWVTLVELLRDSWVALYGKESERASALAIQWFARPFPTFKRLALFAASKDNCVPAEQWIDWLLADGARWLWSVETGREVHRLLVLQGKHVPAGQRSRLTGAILEGPPREMFRHDIEQQQWRELVDVQVWLRLSKLRESGASLSGNAVVRLREITRRMPKLRRAPTERDEFSHWMSGTGDPDFEESRQVESAPRRRDELVTWLVKSPDEQNPFLEDTWRDVLRTRFFHSLGALCDLARADVWPRARWREALQVWSDDALVARSWRFAAALVQSMPDDVLRELVRNVTWWLQAASKVAGANEEMLLRLCSRVLEMPIDADTGMRFNGAAITNTVTEAINHPVGHVTQALLNVWLRRNPNDGDLLPADLKPLFSSICDTNVDKLRHGRIVLASRLIVLFRVDRVWTEQKLLPLFRWTNPEVAKGLWDGFLWSPRLYQPLLLTFKATFLETAQHYADLGEHRRQYPAFLTFVALGPTEGYSVDELRSAFAALPQEALEESAQALAQALEGAAEQREDYWKHRVQPFLRSIWPKSRELATPQLSQSFARLAIASRGEFPAAMMSVEHWLQPLEQSHFIVHLLKQSGLCSKYPELAMRLLDKLVGESDWAPSELRECLREVSEAAPVLLSDARFLRLQTFSRRRGI